MSYDNLNLLYLPQDISIYNVGNKARNFFYRQKDVRF